MLLFLPLSLALGCFAAVQAPAVDFAQIEHQLARAWVDSDRATIDSDVDVVLRFTDVFALHDGRWQVVASQGTQSAP